MVGDNWEWDIAQAASVGIPVYWIAEPDEVPPEGDVPLVGQGTLADLWDWVEAGGLAL
jgi:FMN phosphatase YigB (HAD superfamily)